MKQLLEQLKWPNTKLDRLGVTHWHKQSLNDKNEPIEYTIEVSRRQATFVEALVDIKDKKGTHRQFHAQWATSPHQDNRLVTWDLNGQRQSSDDVQRVITEFQALLSGSEFKGFQPLGFMPNSPNGLSEVQNRLRARRQLGDDFSSPSLKNK